MPRNPSGKKSGHKPLLHQIDPSVPAAFKKGKTERIELPSEGDAGDDDQTPQQIDGRLSKRTLQLIKEQRREVDLEDVSAVSIEDLDAAEKTRAKLSMMSPSVLLGSDALNYDNADDQLASTGIRGGNDDDDDDFEEHDDTFADYDQEEGDLDILPEDRALIEAFLPQSSIVAENLTDRIVQGTEQRQRMVSAGVHVNKKEGQKELKSQVSKDVMLVYQRIGFFLHKYRSGKLPKAFKIIPSLRNWEELLYYTNPGDWTPAATHAAVKSFITVLTQKNAQRFFSLVIGPKVTEQIAAEGRLGYHLYQSLCRAIFKPTAFFKGLILPLAAGEQTTFNNSDVRASLGKEAIVYASVLNRIHIPQMHAAVTLLQMSKIMPFNPYNVLFMRVIIHKKYSLPIPVIESMLIYFFQTAHDTAHLSLLLNPKTGKEQPNLPLLWHKTLLSFVKTYKQHFNDDMVAMARVILSHRSHHAVTEVIRQELNNIHIEKQGEQIIINTDMLE